MLPGTAEYAEPGFFILYRRSKVSGDKQIENFTILDKGEKDEQQKYEERRCS